MPKAAIRMPEGPLKVVGDHPLKVTSGYRDSTCNASVGGAPLTFW